MVKKTCDYPSIFIEIIYGLLNMSEVKKTTILQLINFFNSAPTGCFLDIIKDCGTGEDINDWYFNVLHSEIPNPINDEPTIIK